MHIFVDGGFFGKKQPPFLGRYIVKEWRQHIFVVEGVGGGGGVGLTNKTKLPWVSSQTPVALFSHPPCLFYDALAQYVAQYVTPPHPLLS